MKKEYSSIRFEVTSKCNISCLYCHNLDYTNRADDLTYEEIILLIKNLKQIFPINKILLTGGEPLLQTKIVDIVKKITDLGIKTDLVTNGKKLTYGLLKQLIDVGLKRIRLSIDGFKEHELYRVGSSAEELWKFAEWLVKNTNINVCIHTVCSPHNINTLYDIYRKNIEIGVHRWRVFDIGYQGGGLNSKHKITFEQYYRKLFNKAKLIIKDYINNNFINNLDMEINGIFRTEHLKIDTSTPKVNITDYTSKNLNLSPCNYISHQLTIRNNGIGTFCQYFHNEIFNFKKYNFNILKAIDNKKNVPENNIIIKNLHYCSECKYLNLCNGGCRARAEKLTGNILLPDPISCYFVPKIVSDIVPIYSPEMQAVFYQYINMAGKETYYKPIDLSNFLKKGDFLF